MPFDPTKISLYFSNSIPAAATYDHVLLQGGVRDAMVKDFVRASVKIGRERDRVIALKQESVGNYCTRLHEHMSVYALRAQICRYVTSLRTALDTFPDIR